MATSERKFSYYSRAVVLNFVHTSSTSEAYNDIPLKAVPLLCFAHGEVFLLLKGERLHRAERVIVPKPPRSALLCILPPEAPLGIAVPECLPMTAPGGFKNY
jgi:hypothetical protein